jgi:hypothetical protein
MTSLATLAILVAGALMCIGDTRITAARTFGSDAEHRTAAPMSSVPMRDLTAWRVMTE